MNGVPPMAMVTKINNIDLRVCLELAGSCFQKSTVFFSSIQQDFEGIKPGNRENAVGEWHRNKQIGSVNAPIHKPDNPSVSVHLDDLFQH